MHHHHGHHSKQHHHHHLGLGLGLGGILDVLTKPTICVESKPIVKETIFVQTNQQPMFVQKPIMTYSTPTMFTTPMYTTQSCSTPVYTTTPTCTMTPTMITTNQSYTTPTYTTQTYTTPTYTTPTYTTPTYTGPTTMTTAPTYSTQSYPTQSYPTQSLPTQSYPTQSYPTQSYPTQSYPTQSYPQTTGTSSFDPTKHPNFKGVVGPMTKNFNDQALLIKYSDHKIAVINIGHTDNGCTGLSAQYYSPSQNMTVKGDQHYGTAHSWGGKDECILLEIDEYIIEIFGKQSKVIESLGFKTTKGRIVEFGGNNGYFFKLTVPPGYHFSSLAGGIGEFLDYISFGTAQIPVKQTYSTSQPTTTNTFQPNYKPY